MVLISFLKTKARNHMIDQEIWRIKINGAYKFFEDNNEKFISSSKKFPDGRMFEKEQKITEFALGSCPMLPCVWQIGKSAPAIRFEEWRSMVLISFLKTTMKNLYQVPRNFKTEESLKKNKKL